MKSRYSRTRLLGAAACCCVMLVPISAAALTFENALQLAERQSPSLQAEASKLIAAKQSATPAGELPDPKLLLGLQNLPIDGDAAWRPGEDGMTMQMIGLMQEVPNRDKREARVALAQAGISRAEAERHIEALKVRQATAQAWIATHTVERKQHLFSTLYDENRLLAETVQAKIAGGRGEVADAVIPRQEAALLAEREDELIQLRSQARASLTRWIGEAGQQPLSGNLPGWSVDGQAMLSRVQAHPEIAAYAPKLREAQARIGEATAETKPDWSWEVDYLKRGREYGDMVNLTFSFDLPIFQRSRQSPRIAARHAQLNQLEAERDASQRAFAEQLSVELAELQRIQRALTRTVETFLPLAQERADLALAGYRAGTSELDTVLDARRELIETRLKQIDLEGLHAIAAARLHFAYGDAP
ncbi:TolC family protein [Pseudomonas sp. DNDY-54]|uniref:TolC family protein n=1 Tax=Pseudomonas sp. DNDY-54 TaxID=2870860 RepID=UPI001CA463C1